MAEHDYGAFAAALAAAQRAFPAIPRDREVKVQTKSGASYAFRYAPLDTILAAVRTPLADNGFAIVQLLDDDMLVTSLLHESGAIMSGRTPLPQQTEGIQAFGSAITYLRRYAIQALLGIAAEEDDDGNRAAGNSATFRARDDEPGPAREPEPSDEPVYIGPWSETGRLIVRKSGPADGRRREGPDGPDLLIAFGTVDGKQLQIHVRGALVQDLLDAAGDQLDGLVCTVEGDLYRVPWRKAGRSMPPYQRLDLARIKTAGWTLPVPGAPFPDPEAERELDGLLP